MPNSDNFILEPVPHEEASRWIADKPIVSREVFDSLLPELKARAFLITGIEDANVASEVRALIAELPAGAEWETQKKAITEKLSTWFEPEAALMRAEMLLRTHGFQAYQVAQHRVMERQVGAFPFWQYLSMDDEKVRPAHAALNEKVAPASDTFWHDHSPPWQWSCRCRKVPLLPEEVDDILAEDTKALPEDRRVLEGVALDRARLGQLAGKNGVKHDIRSERMRGKPNGYHFDPGSLSLPVKDLKSRYDDVTWGEFEGNAKKRKLDDGRNVWAWLNGAKAARFTAGQGTGSRKTASERRAENAEIMGRTPARKSPLSKDVTIVGSDAHAQAMRKATLLSDLVHDDGQAPPLVGNADVLHPGAAGEYRKEVGQVGVIKSADQPVIVTLHEMGHHIATHVIGAEARARIKRTVEQTPTWEKLITHAGNLGYWADPEEVFCRVYAQFVAQRSGDSEAIAEIRAVMDEDDTFFAHWPAAEFAGIEKAMERELRRVKWL